MGPAFWAEDNATLIPAFSRGEKEDTRRGCRKECLGVGGAGESAGRDARLYGRRDARRYVTWVQREAQRAPNHAFGQRTGARGWQRATLIPAFSRGEKENGRRGC